MSEEKQYTNAGLARDYVRLVTGSSRYKNMIEESEKVAEVISKLEIDLPAMYRQYGTIPRLTRYGISPIARRGLLEVLGYLKIFEHGLDTVVRECGKDLAEVLEQRQRDLKQGPKK